jgi:hypothetical protein
MYIPRNPYFSEFSYGYALTENLVSNQGGTVTVAPIFPSLIEEGNVGFDVLISRPSVPLFLQFKLSHRMVRRSAAETRAGDFDPPFFRMHLRSSAQSNQHSLLLALEQEGNNEVFYVAPAFYSRAELNEAYSAGQVWNQSFQLRPSQVGPLDQNDHHIAFQFPGEWKVYSEESYRKRGETADPRHLISRWERRVREERPPPLQARLRHLDEGMIAIVTRRQHDMPEWRGIDVGPLERGLTPLRRVSYLARHFFDCQFFVVTEKFQATS